MIWEREVGFFRILWYDDIGYCFVFKQTRGQATSYYYENTSKKISR